MVHATANAVRAQSSCAQSRPSDFSLLPPDVRTAIEGAATLDSKLRAYLASFTADRPCTLSAPELAGMFSKGDDGQIRRALRRMRRTYKGRLREERRFYRRITLTVARWIDPPQLRQGVGADRDLNSEAVVTRDHRKAIAARARAREHASRSPHPRRRARRLELPRLAIDPLAIDGGVLNQLVARHGRQGLADALTFLRRLDVQARPEEARRAVRTLAQRTAGNPGGLLEHLWRQACIGDLLCDAAADAERVRAAELAERAKDPDWTSRERMVRPPPDPLRARIKGLRDRLELLAAAHPHRELLEQQLAALLEQLAAQPPPPPPETRRVEVHEEVIHRRWSECGPRTGLVRRIPGTTLAMVVHVDREDPQREKRALKDELEGLDFEALDSS